MDDQRGRLSMMISLHLQSVALSQALFHTFWRGSSYAGGRRGKERAARNERSSDWRRGAAGSPDPDTNLVTTAQTISRLPLGAYEISISLTSRPAAWQAARKPARRDRKGSPSGVVALP